VTHHNEEHHQHHQKEREHEKKLEKAHEEIEMHQVRTIHPGWFVALGVALIAGVLYVWIVLWS
jgi:hypothetical protein